MRRSAGGSQAVSGDLPTPLPLRPSPHAGPAPGYRPCHSAFNSRAGAGPSGARGWVPARASLAWSELLIVAASAERAESHAVRGGELSCRGLAAVVSRGPGPPPSAPSGLDRPLPDPRTWFPSPRSSVYRPRQTQAPESSSSRTRYSRSPPPGSRRPVSAPPGPRPRHPSRAKDPSPGETPGSPLPRPRNPAFGLRTRPPSREAPAPASGPQTLHLPRTRNFGAVNTRRGPCASAPSCYSTQFEGSWVS